MTLHISLKLSLNKVCLTLDCISKRLRYRIKFEFCFVVRADPPADVSVFASGANRFVCRARGNPPPVFVWLMLGDSNKTVITTSPLLDLGQVTASGQFRFLCMVSNVVNGRRFEVNKDIELNVRGRSL